MKVIWLPEPYEAAIAISDDPDICDFHAFKTMYDFLMKIDFPTTRAMWVYKNREPTGSPLLDCIFYSPLLTDSECLDYCRLLNSKGFEICLHGASCGNNTREMMEYAFDFLKREIRASSVYICHSKNAENLYWDAHTANSNFERRILELYTKNTCYGEVPGSKYFWGDLCRKTIRYIRLYRTRMLNTLSFNPSMPYHDFSKPFVNFWFSATKGHIPRLFTKTNLDFLCKQNGAGILYQYLHKYVLKDGTILKEVREALEMAANDSRLLKQPVSVIMDRLKLFQNIVTINYNGKAYIIKANKNPVGSLQIKLDTLDEFHADSFFKIDKVRKTAVFETINPLSFISIKTSDKFTNSKKYKIKDGLITINFSKATIFVNTLPKAISLNNSNKIPPESVYVEYKTPEAQRLEILQEIYPWELYKLKAGQASILLREHLFLGRKFSTEKYLETPGKIEDLSNW